MHEDSPIQQRDQDEAGPLPTEPTERGSGVAGVMTVVNGVLVGVPAAYVASHSVPVTVITAVLAFGVVLMGVDGGAIEQGGAQVIEQWGCWLGEVGGVRVGGVGGVVLRFGGGLVVCRAGVCPGLVKAPPVSVVGEAFGR